MAATLGYLKQSQSGLVGIRGWQRSDRSEIARWPASNIPTHWMISSSNEGDRISWAVDYQQQLVGRITLRNMQWYSMYIRPDRVGQGIGSVATELWLTLATDQQLIPVFLEVATDNQRALACWQKCGFSKLWSNLRGGYTYWTMIYGTGFPIRRGAPTGAADRNHHH